MVLLARAPAGPAGPAGAADEAAGRGAGVLAVLQDLDAIDEHVVHSARELLRLGEGRGVADRRGVDFRNTPSAAWLPASEPKSLPSGQSLVWAVAKERGGYESMLRYPGEDETYEAARMDALGL